MKRIIFVIIICICVVTLLSCTSHNIDYSKDNDFNVKYETIDVEMSEDSNSKVKLDLDIVSPENGDAKFGLIFYVGTAIPTAKYYYLAEALAKQGFVVALPQVTLNMTYMQYKETLCATEKVISMYSDVKFFVGGHSQGGGAAMRYAVTNQDNLLGALFLSPLCYDEYTITNEDGTETKQFDTLKESNLPVLLLEAANDHVLTDDMKEDALARMSEGFIHHIINPGAHMSFSTMDADSVLKMFLNDGDGISSEGKEKQRIDTIKYVLEFMKSNLPNE